MSSTFEQRLLGTNTTENRTAQHVAKGFRSAQTFSKLPASLHHGNQANNRGIKTLIRANTQLKFATS